MAALTKVNQFRRLQIRYVVLEKVYIWTLCFASWF